MRMKKLIFMFLAILLCGIVQAQTSEIILNNGKVVKGKIINVTFHKGAVVQGYFCILSLNYSTKKNSKKHKNQLFHTHDYLILFQFKLIVLLIKIGCFSLTAKEKEYY